MGITIGHTLSGKYRLLRLLGDGGMGAVFEAQHEKLGTRVAIKVIHTEIASRPGIVDRFLQEARVSAQIKSPHVTQVIDVDQTGEGEAYMVMELLEGQTLLGILDREKRLPLATAAQYTIQILEGLEAAHALGVVHRDLKPENVFVTFTAKKPVLKLIDFGIAKVRRDEPGQKNLTMAGVTMGTAEYMAPEQAFSADRADARSDVYAVGVMFYEMLSGTRPVLGEDARVVATKVEQGDVTPLIHVVPEVPPAIAGLIHQAMAPRPDLRFQSAAEMRLALEHALTGAPRPVAPDVLGPTAPAFDHGPAAAAVPGAAQLAEQPAGPNTVRGGGPVDPGAFSPMPGPMGPVDPGGYSPAQQGGPMMASYAGAPAPRRSSGGGGGMWLIVAGIAVLLGVGVVVVLALQPRDTDVIPVATSTATTVAPTAATSGTVPTTDTVQPLATLGTVVVPPPGTGGVRPALPDAAVAMNRDAGTAADAGAPPPFTFPFPPMDGGLTFPPMPSGFPPIPTFPGFGTPPPQ